MSSVEKITQISKFLSFVLRHNPDSIGLQLDPAGWADVQSLIACASKHGTSFSRDDLIQVVASNDKKRFSFSTDGDKIRANQGHSLSVELGLDSVTPPDLLYHGTAERFIDSIRAEGLKKLERHHVHLTESIDVASAVGSRYGKLVLLEVDAKAMNSAGHLFYLSANNVWLTDHVPSQFIKFPA